MLTEDDIALSVTLCYEFIIDLSMWLGKYEKEMDFLSDLIVFWPLKLVPAT